jgi:hypothetical protein
VGITQEQSEQETIPNVTSQLVLKEKFMERTKDIEKFIDDIVVSPEA